MTPNPVTVRTMVTLQQVKAVQPNWFSPENKRFFGDVSYRVLQGGDGKPYLVRATYQWFDMFRQPKTLWYRVNTINPDLTIGSLVNKQFKDINEVKDWLKSNRLLPRQKQWELYR